MAAERENCVFSFKQPIFMDVCGNSVFKISLALTVWCTDTGFCVWVIPLVNVHAGVVQIRGTASVGVVRQRGNDGKKV